MQRRDLVIEVVTALVETAGVQGQRTLQEGRVDTLCPGRPGSRVGLLQQVEHAPRITIGIPHQRVHRRIVQYQVGQHPRTGTLHQLLQLTVGQRLQHIHLGP